PKKFPDANGNVTTPDNNVSFGGIVHKMGINGSATCSINFDGSKGVLVGTENEGLKAMFTMMNDARLNVAIQGISMSEAAWQNAAIYSTIRVQGKSLKDSFNKNAKPTEIINHANIRRDLIEMKSQIDGFRALALDTAIALDLAEKHPDAKVREQA